MPLISSKKILLLAAGLLSGLLLAAVGLELALRAYGHWAANAAQKRAPASGRGRTVLCAGDSFVYGVGGTPFPHQLEEILNARQSALKFRVINAGEAGTGTTQMLEKLPAQLDAHKPDYLILLSGVSNKWTQGALRPSYGYLPRLRLWRFWRILLSMKKSGALERPAETACPDNYPDERRWLSLNTSSPDELAAKARLNTPALSLQALRIKAGFLEIDSALYKTKISEAEAAAKRLDVILNSPPPQSADAALRSVWEKINAASGFKLAVARGYMYNIVDHRLAIKGFEQAIALRPDYLFGYLNILELYRAAGDKDNFMKYAGLLRAKAPDFAPLYLELSWFYWLNEKPDESFAEFGKALELAPCSEHLLKNAPFLFNDVARHMAEYEKRAPLIRQNPAYAQYLRLRRRVGLLSKDYETALLEKGIEQDLIIAGERARARGAWLLMSSYPSKDVAGVRRAAEKLGVPYIDFVSAFAARFKSADLYTAFDGDHCNTAGYRFMAETYADAILRREAAKNP